ncbi:hypothetical protein [Streptomyces sp. NPDC048825]|uniref:hypothetical protein n=1 Tax=Streptomyces sp. NPDC048825 TaxID=3365592 RepID=UPI003720C44A
MQDLERITDRRSELDTLAEELAKHLQEVQAEREELVIAERVLNRLAEQDRAAEEAAATVAPTPARVAGRAMLLIPHRSENPDEAALTTARSWRSCGPPTARCRSGVSARNRAWKSRCAANWNRCARR